MSIYTAKDAFSRFVFLVLFLPFLIPHVFITWEQGALYAALASVLLGLGLLDRKPTIALMLRGEPKERRFVFQTIGLSLLLLLASFLLQHARWIVWPGGALMLYWSLVRAKSIWDEGELERRLSRRGD